MDIKFGLDGRNFNVRSSCIIKNKDHSKVLLTVMRAVTDHKAFLLPGGRVMLSESSEAAVAREIREELNLDLKYDLASIEENFSSSRKFHMLEFVYYAEIDSFEDIALPNNDWDKFEIVEIKDIDAADIRPRSLKELIKSERIRGIRRHVNHDWE